MNRTSYLVTLVFTYITAAVIAEVCSASPSAGSIYLWAAEAGGPRFGRLLGFIVAWWSTTAWTTFCASNTQAAVNYMLSVSIPQNSLPNDPTLTHAAGADGVQCRLSHGHLFRQIPCRPMDLYRDPPGLGRSFELHAPYVHGSVIPHRTSI